MANQIIKWLESYAQEVENEVETPVHCRIGDYKGEYYENGEYIPIQGGLFLTTHNGNLFTVYDKKQDITDYFDVFESNASVKIDEKFFTYIMKNTGGKTYKISLAQIETDIKILNNQFIAFGGAWENEDGDEYGCTPIAQKELELVKGVASRYPFQYEYDPSEFDENSQYYSDEWYAEDVFTIDDFNNNNINTNNYGKADAVAFCFKCDLVEMLEQLKKELEWLPPRFRMEFVELICECEQDAHSVRKNCELFADNIMNELTEEEESKMFITLG